MTSAIIRSLTTVAIICCTLALPATALAHKPIFTDDAGASFATAVPIADPDISWAIYASLESSEIDHYRFTGTTGGQLFAEILIPKIEGLQDYHPSFALIGPGLPSANVTLPVDVQSLGGALVAEGSESTGVEFFEPFTQTSYWSRQEMRVDLPADGTYYLIVFDRKGNPGKYVLAVGWRESFGVWDIVQLPATWWRVHSWFGHRFLLLAVTSLSVAVAILLTLLVSRARAFFRPK